MDTIWKPMRRRPLGKSWASPPGPLQRTSLWNGYGRVVFARNRAKVLLAKIVQLSSPPHVLWIGPENSSPSRSAMGGLHEEAVGVLAGNDSVRAVANVQY